MALPELLAMTVLFYPGLAITCSRKACASSTPKDIGAPVWDAKGNVSAVLSSGEIGSKKIIKKGKQVVATDTAKVITSSDLEWIKSITHEKKANKSAALNDMDA